MKFTTKSLLSLVVALALIVTSFAVCFVTVSAEQLYYKDIWTAEDEEVPTMYTSNYGGGTPLIDTTTYTDPTLKVSTNWYDSGAIVFPLGDVSFSDIVGVRVYVYAPDATPMMNLGFATTTSEYDTSTAYESSKFAAYSNWQNYDYTPTAEGGCFTVTWQNNDMYKNDSNLQLNGAYMKADKAGFGWNNTAASKTTFTDETVKSIVLYTKGIGSSKLFYIKNVQVISTEELTSATKYTVTYASDAGGYVTVPSSAKVVEGADYTVEAPTAVDSKYNFTGWTDGTNTYAAGDTISNVTGDITLTATVASKYTIDKLWKADYYDADDYALASGKNADKLAYVGSVMSVDEEENALKLTKTTSAANNSFAKQSYVALPLSSNLSGTTGIRITLKDTGNATPQLMFGLGIVGYADWRDYINVRTSEEESYVYTYNGNKGYNSEWLTAVSTTEDGYNVYELSWDTIKLWGGGLGINTGMIMSHTVGQKYLAADYTIDESTLSEFLSKIEYLYVRANDTANIDTENAVYIKSVEAIKDTEEETDYSGIAGTFSGAQIRLDKAGLRFLSAVDTELIEKAIEEGYTLTGGTLIAPVQSVGEYTNLTLEYKGKKMNLVSSTNGEFDTYTYNETEYLAGTIANIKENNYPRGFYGRAYITLTKDDESTTYYSSLADEDTGSRNIAAIAYTIKAADYTTGGVDVSAYQENIDAWAAAYTEE